MIIEAVSPAVLVILFLLAVVMVIATGVEDVEYYKQADRDKDKAE